MASLSASGPAASSGAGAASGPAAVEEKVVEEEPEEEVDMGGLFGGGDDDYWAVTPQDNYIGWFFDNVIALYRDTLRRNQIVLGLAQGGA